LTTFNLRGRVYLEDLNVDGKIILKWFLMKWDVRVWNSLVGIRGGYHGQEHGNDPSDFINCGEFLDYLRTRWLLMKVSAPESDLVVTCNHRILMSLITIVCHS
jgi:hypothetical protein